MKLGWGAGEDRRKVNRIQQFASAEFSALLTVNGKIYKSKVIDFHFAGVRIEALSDSLRGRKIDFIELVYGNNPISKVVEPILISEGDSGLSLSLLAPKKDVKLPRHGRFTIKNHWTPVVTVDDPIRINSRLHLTVLNLNQSGMQLETSLSNKHLLMGMVLRSADILLPGVGSIKADLEIRHLSLNNQRLILGTQFKSVSKTDLENLARFTLIGAQRPLRDSEDKLGVVRRAFGKLKKLGTALKIENLSTSWDFEQVLRVRHEAYMSAGIITPDTTFGEMVDEFDERSIIFGAKLDGVVVGTMRLVRCVHENHRFMFESDISFDELKIKGSRLDFLEVSRLAVLPSHQDTDIVLRLFQEAARQVIINGKNALCLARKSQRKSYGMIGFRLVSKEIPHPLLNGETLGVMEIIGTDFLNGSRMAGLSWRLLSKEVGKNLEFAGVAPRFRWQLINEIRASVGGLALKILRKIKRR